MKGYSLIIIIISLSTIFNPQQRKYPVKTKTVDEIKVINNPDYPRDGRIDLKLEEDLIIGVEEGDENYIFDFPTQIEVADNGNIFISICLW